MLWNRAMGDFFMAKKYGLALIGCGHIGAAHLDGIYYRDNIILRGVADIDAGRARLFQKKYGAETFTTDYHDLISRADVDIVIIAAYTPLHLPILKECLAAGKHVLCEKPIADNLSDGLSFCDLVAGSKSKVLVGLVLRHNETYQKAAALIAGGAIGKVRLMRMVQNHHALNWPRYRTLLESCPPIIDCGVHYFDIMQWFTGAKVISVGGVSAVIGPDVPKGTYNYGLVTLKLSDGSIGYYESGWAMPTAHENLKEFVGDTGRLRIVLNDDRESDREEGDLIELYDAKTGKYSFINNHAVYKNTYAQLQCLIGMIENGDIGTPSPEDVLSSFKVSIAADRALRDNRIYRLDENTQNILDESEPAVLRTAAPVCHVAY